jgi:hypothetical protein
MLFDPVSTLEQVAEAAPENETQAEDPTKKQDETKGKLHRPKWL